MFFFFSSRRRHTSWPRDWSSDVCSSDLDPAVVRVEAEDAGDRSGNREQHRRFLRSLRADRDDGADRQEAADLRPQEDAQSPQRPSLERPDEVGDAPGKARPEREHDGRQSTGRVAAIASSWFAWYRTAASAVRAVRES